MTSEDNGPLHLELRKLPDVVLVQDTCTQATEGLTGLADLDVYLLVKASNAADNTAEVLDVVHRLQLGASDRDGRRVGNGGWCKLEH